jgi:hypothetical protein
MSEQEYIVSLNRGVDVLAFDAEMISLTGAGFIPNRTVEIANARPGSQRNTHYYLTLDEVNILQNDKRVYGVELRPDLRDDIEMITFASQTGDFSKTTESSSDKLNWGMRRMISATNPYVGNIVSGDFTHTLSGAGVDIVIQDTGIQADHPEFLDAKGVNRVQEIDWYQSQSVVSGTMPTAHYTDYHGHGTHVGGTAAGQTYGWAKNARIYAVKVAGLEGSSDPNSGISISDCFDVIKEWHKAKPVDASTGVVRPTVVNMSWGYGTRYSSITGGNFRGFDWTGSIRDTSKGMTGYFDGIGYRHPVRIASVDTDVQELIDAGVHVVIAAGNSYTKIADEGFQDYNNYYTTAFGQTIYYHRGSSPFDDQALMVGAVDSVLADNLSEKVAAFSNRGPGVDIYAPGVNIISSSSNVSIFTSGIYPGNTDYKTANISGTSMASPQIAGLLATYLEIEPATTTAQGKTWITSNAISSLLYNPIEDVDLFTSTVSLFGGPNVYAFQPYNSAIVLQAAGTVSSEEEEEVAVPTYALTSTASGVNEGDTFTITLTTTNLVASTIVPYTITGVNSTDIGGASLTGNFIVGGASSITIQASADTTFDDGTETFTLALDNGEATTSVTIADTSLPTATYFLSLNDATPDEGTTLIVTLTTGNVATGTTLGYTISGVTSSDISDASLTGSFVVGTTDIISLVLNADETSEGQESLTFALDNGEATVIAVIADSSTVAATYTLAISATQVNEGQSLDVTVTGLNSVPGVVLPWTITGVSASDVVGNVLTGSFVIGTTETATITLANDLTTDGNETLQFTLNAYPTVYVQALIIDTSLDIVSGTSAFTSAGGGTFVVPDGVTNIGIMAVGGGAAGLSGGSAGTITSGGGGGAVGFKNNITVTPGDVIAFTIGTGGSGSSANGGNTSITINSITYTAGGGIAGSSSALSSLTVGALIAGGNGGGVSGPWDGSKSGGTGGASFRPAAATGSAVVGGGGGAAGMGADGGKGSPQTAISVAAGQLAPAETTIDGTIGSGGGGGHGWTQDWQSGTGAVTGARGGGVAVTLGRSGLGGLKATTVTSQTITGAGTASNGVAGGTGNVVGAALAAGAAGGGVLVHSLAGSAPGANSGIAGALMFTWPGDITAYQFQAPSYALSSDKASVSEGTSFVITLANNITVTNTPIPYTISGVTSADITNETLTSNLTPASNTKTIAVTADSALEGDETFTMTLDNGTSNVSVAIADTSTGSEQSFTSNVTNAGSGAWSYSSATDRNAAFTGNNPFIVLNKNDTMAFTVNATGHPFYIKTQVGIGTENQVDDVTNNGTQSGVVTYTPRTSGKTYYQCSAHTLMNGTIYTSGTYWAKSTDYTSASESVIKVVVDSIGSTIAISKSTTISNVYTYYVYKLNINGELVWRKAIPSTGFLQALYVDVSTNDIYVAGGIDKNMIDGTIDKNVSTGKCQVLVVKLDTDGATQWINKYTKSAGIASHAWALDIMKVDLPSPYTGTSVIDVIGVVKVDNWGTDGTGSFWDRLDPTNGTNVELTSGSTTYYYPGLVATNSLNTEFTHIAYKQFTGLNSGNFYYIAGISFGRVPTQVGGAWTQQKDKIFVRIYEIGGTGLPTEYKEITFENKDATTDITIGGMDVEDQYTVQEEVDGEMTDVIKYPGIVVTLNDTSSGKGEVWRIQHQGVDTLQRISLYDGSGTTERNVLTDVKIDGTKIYVVGQQKEDTAKNFTPYVGALNGFYATIDTADLTTADSRLLLTTGNTFINSVYVDKSAASPTKLIVGGQGSPGSKLPSGNASQFVATLPIGTEDHYGAGIGNSSSGFAQTYEDWAIGKTGFVEARTAGDSNFTGVTYNSWSAAQSLTVSESASAFARTALSALSSPSVTSEYKMPLDPYTIASGGTATYALVSSASTVNEGATIVFTLTTSNVANDVTVAYTMTGIQSADIGGESLTGTFTVNNNSATLSVVVTADQSADGEETLLLTLDGLSVTSSVIINDSSANPTGSVAFYSPGATVWTVPSGVTSIDMVAVGGGGGGMVGRGSDGSGGGGAGGGLAYCNNITVSPGDTFTITVGAGGNRGDCSGYYTDNYYKVFVDSDFTANITWSPVSSGYGTITDPTNGGNSTVKDSGNNTIIYGNGGGKAYNARSGGFGGTFQTNSDYGTTRGGGNGMAGGGGGVATGNNSAGGGGGGAAGYDNSGDTSSGGGGRGGQGRAQHASTNSNGDLKKNGLAGRGGGVELHGKGTTGGTGTRSPYLVTYSYPYTDYTDATNGGVGSNSNDATISVGGGGGGGNGGRIRYQDYNANNNNAASYYKWFAVAQGPDNAQDGGVRIQWGASDYP